MANVKVYCEADVATWSSGIAAGAGLHLPVGDYSSADYRSAMRFPTPPGWTAWTAITKATITFFISDFQHVSPDNSNIYCSRMNVTYPIWTKGEGSQSCESGFTGSNTSQYDDIGSSATDRVGFASGTAQNAAKTLDVTAAMRYYWGNGSQPTLKPVFVFDNNGANQWTEIWSRNKGGSYVAYLSIDYEVQSPPTAPTLTGPANSAVSQTDTPTLSWTHNDPQGDAQAQANVQIWDYLGTTLYGTYNVPNANQFYVTGALTRGGTYQWCVQTADAASGFGPYSAKQSFSIKANPVVTVSATRKMVWQNNAPRLVAEWTTDQPQSQFRVTAPGYDSGIRAGGDQSWVLDTLALTNGVVVAITVQVWNTDSPALTSSAARSFTPRYGQTMHYRQLAVVPTNWQAPDVRVTTPPGTQVVMQYGSGGTTGGPSSGWFSSITSVPKSRDLWYNAWLIPSATQSPSLDYINIPYDSTIATLDKWGANAHWPWEDFGPIPARFAVDTGEAVYGTRSLRCDPDGTTLYHIISGSWFKVREGRSYTLSGLMRSQGKTGQGIQIQSISTVYTKVYGATLPGVLNDWARYKAPVWVAPADMDVYVVAFTDTAVAGSSCWWDGIKVEESIIATPWNPAQVGATTVDAGGIQIDGNKGGILRYRGTNGGPNSVVEGGVAGLKFGGAELYGVGGSRMALSDGADILSMGSMSSGSGGGTEGYWWKAASGSMLGQYWASNFMASAMMQGLSGPDDTSALVSVAIYQYDVMGTKPSASIRVLSSGNWQPSDFKVVFPSITAGASQWEFWIRSPWPWFNPMFKVLQQRMEGGASALITYHAGLLVAASSAGPADIGRAWQNDIQSGTVAPAANFDGQRWWHTGRKTEYYWDSAVGRWLSTTKYEHFVDLGSAGLVSAASGVIRNNILLPKPWSAWDGGPTWVWFESAQFLFSVAGATALSGANSWALQVNRTPSDAIVGYAMINSGAVGSATRTISGLQGQQFDSGQTFAYLMTNKVGAPGNISVYGFSLSYRLMG